MAIKRQIDVRKQKQLSYRATFALCVSGIRHRIVRSLLTLAVMTLAIAFFMFLLTENTFLGALDRGINEQIERAREAGAVLGFMYAIPSTETLSALLAERAGDPAALDEMAKVAGVSRESLAAPAEAARQAQVYLRFFDGLRIGQRIALLEKRRGAEIFRRLVDKDAFAEFKDRLDPMGNVKLPGGYGQLREFLSGYAAYEVRLADFHRRWSEALGRFRAESDTLTEGAPIELWLAAAAPDDARRWQELVRRHGFRMDDMRLARMQSDLREQRVRNDIAATLNLPEKIQSWKNTFHENVSTEAKMLALGRREAAKILDRRYTPEELAEIAAGIRLETRLNALEKTLRARTEKRAGGLLSGRQVFLLALSFVVCMVGISNAMLMAITERFREIATLKCLGATDRFILLQFMMEAGLQGLVGGAIGVVVGFSLAGLKNWLVFGGYLGRYFPAVMTVEAALMALVTGVLLATLASIYPSWAASRMAPMEAMRIE